MRQRAEEPAAILLHADRRRPHLEVRRQALHARRRADPRRPTARRSPTRKGRRSFVTSAGAGPSIGKHILMSYLPPEHAVVGERPAVQYMGELYPVTVGSSASTLAVRPGEREDPLMRVLVCVKRVPMTGGRIVLTEDEQAIETRHLGFTGQPARGVRRRGGGPAGRGPRRRVVGADARAGRGRGAAARPDGDRDRPRHPPRHRRRGVGSAGDRRRRSSPRSSAEPEPYDLILFGNESADAGNYQVRDPRRARARAAVRQRDQGDRGRGRQRCAASRRSPAAATSTSWRCRPWSP